MTLDAHKRLILLASSSPYRKMLLQRLGLRFETYDPEVNETPQPGESAAPLVQRLALAKASAAIEAHPSALVIGSDQVAECQGRIIGKPGNASNARRQLQQFRGETVCFFSAVAVLDGPSGGKFERMISTTVVFRQFLDEEIDRYLEMDRPYDCAGSFKSEQAGVALMSRISSDDPTALIGLPLIAVAEALRSFGVPAP